MTGEPSSVRPVRFPAAYGPPGGPDSLLPWSYVEERLRAAANYWITTVGPPARPHARPVDGVWVGGALCFGGSPETRWVRNLIANPSISVHLSSEAEDFSGSESPFRPFWALRPTRAFAWTLEGFPHGATRWRFFEKAVQP